MIRNQRRAAWRQRQEERRQLEEEVNLKVKMWFKSITYIYDELIILLLTCYKISDLSLKVLELLREEREREESLKKKPTWCTTCLEVCLIGWQTNKQNLYRIFKDLRNNLMKTNIGLSLHLPSRDLAFSNYYHVELFSSRQLFLLCLTILVVS